MRLRAALRLTVALALVLVLLAAGWLWGIDAGSLGPRHPLSVVGHRSCPVPAMMDRYNTDPAYRDAWDNACRVFAVSGVEIPPLLDEVGPLDDTLTCAGVWNLAEASCAPKAP